MPDRDTVTGDGCILLFGMPRSGTTWIGKLFDSHPDVLYRHEPDSWSPLAMPRDPSLDDAADHARELQEFVARLPDIRAQRVAGKRPLFAKAYMSTPRARLMDVGVEFARVVSRFYPDFPVLFHVNARRYADRRIVWKSINSLGRLGTALTVLPEARGVHLLRHPCGYIASVNRGLAGNSFSSANSNSEDYGIFAAVEGTPLGERYGIAIDRMKTLTPVERLAWRWVLINEKAWRESRDTGRYHCVYYEDVCRAPETRLRALFDACGLSWNEQTADFVARSTRSARSGYYSVYKDPEISARRWREELDADTVEKVMAIVARSEIGAPYMTMQPPAEHAR